MAKSQEFPTLSIIIPTLNEADRLPLLLADLKPWPYRFEVVVVDGGSTDLTTWIAEAQGSKVIKNLQANRGNQLNIGASSSKGDWLLFLHADSRLGQEWTKNLIQIISNSSSEESAWYFDFKINKKNLQFRILEIAVALRSHFLKRPYGDQGLLIHRNLYNLLGGFYPLKIMEDLDFITRVAKKRKVKRIGVCLYTDIKKWLNSNIYRRAIKNAILRKKWRNGYNHNQLSKEYYS